MIGKAIGNTVLWAGGWKLTGNIPKEDKFIIIEAPHTSNWDFFWGFFGILKTGVRTNFLIKKDWFFFPLGPIMRGLGGVPVDRKNSVSLVEQLIHQFEKRKKFGLLITPEGTRKPVKRWKHGFLFIAYKTHVPIYLGNIDYNKKELHIGKSFFPTGNEKEDMNFVTRYYKNLNAAPKYPENFILEDEK